MAQQIRDWNLAWHLNITKCYLPWRWTFSWNTHLNGIIYANRNTFIAAATDCLNLCFLHLEPFSTREVWGLTAYRLLLALNPMSEGRIKGTNHGWAGCGVFVMYQLSFYFLNPTKQAAETRRETLSTPSCTGDLTLPDSFLPRGPRASATAQEGKFTI